MTVCARIVAGVVENLIVAEADDPVEEDVLLVANPPDWVTLGTPWDGKDFVAPPPLRAQPGEGVELL